MKHKIGMAQWYISHTCNLSCNNCLSLNNYAIGGHESWKDNESYVKAWSEKLEVEDLSVIGGEPLTNPDIHQWVLGVRKYFDTVDFKVCTNGTLLDRHIDNIKQWIDNGVILEISYHDPAHKQKIMESLSQILKDTNCNWVEGKNYKGDPEYYSRYDTIIYIDNRISILLTANTRFRKFSIDNQSDQEVAHKTCFWKNCHYLYRGELYKCGAIVGAQKLAEKYNLKNKKLIDAYRPIGLHSNDFSKNLDSLKNSIPQCSMCPQSIELDNIYPVKFKKSTPEQNT